MCAYYNIEALLRPSRCTHTHTHTHWHASFPSIRHTAFHHTIYKVLTIIKPPFQKKTVFGRFKENGVFHLKPCFLLRFSKRIHTNCNVFMLLSSGTKLGCRPKYRLRDAGDAHTFVVFKCWRCCLYGARGRLNLN